jgi:hypothetical protein
MTTLECLDAIAVSLTEILADLKLEIPKGGKRAPQIVPGWLPPNDPRDHGREDDLPYVIPRLAGHDDIAPEESYARVNIYVGTYSKAPDGWRDVANVIERIRQAFLKNRTVAKKFRLELPIKSTILTDEQPYPYWVGWLETRWTIAQPVEEVLIDGEDWP